MLSVAKITKMGQKHTPYDNNDLIDTLFCQTWPMKTLFSPKCCYKTIYYFIMLKHLKMHTKYKCL